MSRTEGFNTPMHCNLVFGLIVFICLALFPFDSDALEPAEILVIANRNAKSSIELAAYYTSKRKIPMENLVKVVVNEDENITGMEYIVKVAIPVRKYLNQVDSTKQKIRCLVVMYGLPLQITDTEISNQNEFKVGQNEILID